MKKSRLILMQLVLISRLGGMVVFGVVTYQFVQFDREYSTYGRDKAATIIQCEMVRGRGQSHPYITYRYIVEGETYLNRELAQQEFDHCASIPFRAFIDIIYLENDPARSFIGSTTDQASDHSTVLVFSVATLIYGFFSLRHIIRIVSYLPRLRLWWIHPSKLFAIPGKIVAMDQTKQHTIKISYQYRSPRRKSVIGRATCQCRRREFRDIPRLGMRVIVLYLDETTVFIA